MADVDFDFDSADVGIEPEDGFEESLAEAATEQPQQPQQPQHQPPAAAAASPASPASYLGAAMETGHGGRAVMDRGVMDRGVPQPPQPPLPPPEVWDRSEAGRRGIESLGDTLAQRVIGQQAAVDMVATTMQMGYIGLQAQSGPLGVFLFVGPSGVGKTELAKALAATLFGEDTDMCRIDCSGFKAKGDVATLVGSPKGYEDSKDGGMLTTFMQAHQHTGSVVLLDEVEKAHPEILDLFLPCFDEGYLTDGRGVRHECKNTVSVPHNRRMFVWRCGHSG
jgi:hypothetical protein